MDKRKRSRMEEKKKAPKDTPSSDSDNGPPEVLPSSRKHFMYQQMAAKNKNMRCVFLYVLCLQSIKDPNGKIARAYMAWWNRKKNKH